MKPQTLSRISLMFTLLVLVGISVTSLLHHREEHARHEQQLAELQRMEAEVATLRALRVQVEERVARLEAQRADGGVASDAHVP